MDWIQFAGGALSFAGGALTFMVAVETSVYTIVKLSIHVWILNRNLAKAYASNNKRQIKDLEFLIQVAKLNSANSVHQSTAIMHLGRSKDSRAVDILAGRLGIKPNLNNANKTLLLATLKKII